MKLPRDLHGVELGDHLCRHWEYVLVHQTGRHIILDTRTPGSQRLAIPAHKPLRIGTLNATLRAVAQHKSVTREQILHGLS